jgi:colanic acid/amylovoran biosynthesis glycosyltransferase
MTTAPAVVEERSAPALPEQSAAKPVRVAYLCDQYPAVSHTFVLREVLELRRLGAEVETFSIHRPHAISATDREEAAGTYSVLPARPLTVVASHLAALARHPLRYVSTLAFALRRGRRVKQLCYFAEAAVLHRECRRRRLPHIHAHFTSPSADVAMLCARLGEPDGLPASFSFSAHGTDIFVGDQLQLAEKVRQAKLVVCVSDFGRGHLMGLVDRDHWAKIRVVRCGIDLDRFAPAARVRDGGPVRLLSVARLHPVKGHPVLIDAVASLIGAGEDVALTVVGDGPARGSLERQARERGVAEHVTFAGSVGQDEILAYYAAADVFCLPSFGEGIPVALMEAMATRLPVVASRVMGVPELVIDGHSGLLVAPGRPGALADALRTLIRDPGLRAQLGQAARARIRDAHEAQHSAVQLYRIYDEAL